MVDPKELEQRIKTGLQATSVTVEDLTGGGDHYRVTVVSEQFAGKAPLARHRLVYATVKDIMGGALHALALDTKTPDELST